MASCSSRGRHSRRLGLHAGRVGMDDRLTYPDRHRWLIWMAYLSRRVDSTEIRQLTGLRGVLALDVVIGHLNVTGMSPIGRIVFRNVAVDFFFTLSGFVLGLTYVKNTSERLDFGRYAVARFARIYPLYLFALLLILVLLLHWQGDNFRTDPPFGSPGSSCRSSCCSAPCRSRQQPASGTFPPGRCQPRPSAILPCSRSSTPRPG